MKWPPYIMKLRFYNGRHHFGLWIPLFLIGPVVLVLLLPIFLIMLVVTLLELIFTWQWQWLRSVVIAVPAIYGLVCSLPGVVVDVDTQDVKVNISVY